MNQTLVIAGREVVERRFVFLAAAAFALLPVVIPFVPGLRVGRRDIITMGSLILASVFTLAVAAILGATIVGNEISGGRMSFYFARPLGAPAIWFGKLAAALLLTGSSFLIVFLPALLLGSPIAKVLSGDVGSLLFSVALLAAILFFLFHAVGTMIRSRSGLIGFDFAAAAITAVAVWMIAGPLVQAMANRAAGHLYRGMIYGALIAAALAGAWQLIDGRSDRRRSHAAFSKAFWSLIGVVLLGGAAFVAWIVSARLGDIELKSSIHAIEAPRGDWAIVTGQASRRFDYRPMFLVNLNTGSAERLRKPYWRSFFSRDGKKLIALMPLGKTRAAALPGAGDVIFGRATVVVRDLATGHQTETNFPTRGFAEIEANDDASRLAIAEDNVLTVYDVVADRSLMSVRCPWPASMSFRTPELLSIYTVSGRPNVLTAYVLDTAHRSLTKTAELTLPGRDFSLSPSPDGSKLLIAPDAGESRFLIVDGQTLQTLSAVAATPGMRESTPRYLSDGRIAFGEMTGGHVVLHVLGTDGVTKTMDLGTGSQLTILREVAPGQVIVDAGGTRVIDIDRGVEVRRVPGVLTTSSGTGGGSWWFYPRPMINSANVLLSRHGLLSWNALTGEAKTLIGN